MVAGTGKAPPYWKGIMVDYLRSQMRPHDPKVAPSELFLGNTKDLTEYTVLRAWVAQWSKYVHWYASKAMSPDVNLEDFFESPIVQDRWL